MLKVFRFKSISSRLILSTLLLIMVVLAGGGLLLSQLFVFEARKQFDAQLELESDSLLGALEIVEDGSVDVDSDAISAEFRRGFSGWYYKLIVSGQQQPVYSFSLTQGLLTEGQSPEFDPFIGMSNKKGSEPSFLDTIDEQDEPLRIRAQTFDLVSDGKEVTVMVAGPRETMQRSGQAFNFFLLVSLSVLAVALLISLVAVVRFSLRPLAVMQRRLGDVRAGRAELLEGDFARELNEVTNEVNLLLSSNSELVERARKHVGNLAHGLKTPIAVMRNSLEEMETQQREELSPQLDSMQNQIERYLALARAATTAQARATKTDVLPLLTSLKRTFEKIGARENLKIFLEAPEALSFPVERQDLLEILGNLIENASRYSEGVVKLTAYGGGTDHKVGVIVEDNGEGVEESKRDLILQRGKRLDELTPGSGLGLSIVKDLVEAYQGKIELGSSELGGLKVVIWFPVTRES